jgi:hypothetical protein
MTVENKILKTELVDWKSLVPFQPDNFKKMTSEQRRKLKTSFLTNGFRAPFYVWESNKKIYCLDGHTRLPILREIEEEGGQIPDLLPANFIACKNKAEAKKAVLIYNSHYASINRDSMLDFISDLNFEEVKTEIDIPGLYLDDPDDRYTRKIDPPAYEPRDQKPDLKSLYDVKKFNELVKYIMAADIPENEKEFFILAAHRHIIFNYERAADYYAHSNKQTQDVMEKLAMVIIDLNSAIENGYVIFSEKVKRLYGIQENGK